jgi:predicted RNA-binding Zn-ribbon protein involved in translation (DUF1610 family)
MVGTGDPSYDEHLDFLKKHGCADCKSDNVSITKCYYTSPLTYPYNCHNCGYRGTVGYERMTHITNISKEDYCKAIEISTKENRDREEVVKEMGGIYDDGDLKIT